jgi:hypothetical protein
VLGSGGELGAWGGLGGVICMMGMIRHRFITSEGVRARLLVRCDLISMGIGEAQRLVVELRGWERCARLGPGGIMIRLGLVGGLAGRGGRRCGARGCWWARWATWAAPCDHTWGVVKRALENVAAKVCAARPAPQAHSSTAVRAAQAERVHARNTGRRARRVLEQYSGMFAREAAARTGDRGRGAGDGGQRTRPYVTSQRYWGRTSGIIGVEIENIRNRMHLPASNVNERERLITS